VVAPEVPGDALRPEVVCPAQVQYLLLDGRRGAPRHVVRAGLAVDEGLLAVGVIGAPPAVEDLARDAEVAAGVGDDAGLVGVLEDKELSGDISVLSVRHEDLHVNSLTFRVNCQPKS